MNTSKQDIKRGARNLMLGVLEAELRDLAAGEKRRYSQALAKRLTLYKEATEKCK